MQLNGQKIKWLREEAGLSGRDLCNLVSISPPFLSQIENDRRGCNPSVAARLAGALGVAIVDLRRETP